jgi:hypothetical protein
VQIVAPDRAWKRAEREAAKTLGGRRFWANSGEDIDVESAAFVCQVKNVQSCSLAQLEQLAREAERQGVQRQKVGLVWIKQRSGRGRETEPLIVMTQAAFRSMSGPLPTDPEAGA